MLKKTIEYTDLNGEKQVKDFYFNLTRSELTEMETGDGMSQMLKTIIASENIGQMLGVFKKLVLASVGVKSDDGQYFLKDADAARNFVYSPAFDVLFTELSTNDSVAAEFIRGIVPADLVVEVEKQQAAEAAQTVQPAQGGLTSVPATE